MRQTRARILHVCFLLYTHLSCSPPYVYVSVNYERLLVIRSGRVGGNRSIRFARLFISIYIYIQRILEEKKVLIPFRFPSS